MEDIQKTKTTILDLLKRSSVNYSEKIALVSNENKITYHDLNLKSNKLSNYLRLNKDLVNKSICFCLNPSIDRVIAMIAIWKTECAYVSLDPFYPEARLQLMMNDTEATTLITTADLAEHFSFFKGQIIILDHESEKVTIEKTTDKQPDKINSYNSLAYLAYTSGSTGIPKAVMAEHQGLANFVQQFSLFLKATSTDNALQISASNFDGIALDLWAPLAIGMTVHIYPDNRILGDELLEFIIEKEITIAPYLPFSILATLPTHGNIGNLRKICTGGEAPSADVINRWKELVIVVNMYGPTETTVVVSCFECSNSHPLNTIGAPFTNVDYYILDENMQAVAHGQTGQLFIGGIQVSRGYLNRPELTAERFLHYTSPEGQLVRVYKTGDLAKLHKDGTAEFVGRADLQVKIRGFRIELTEIEEVMRQSGLIVNCCVVVKGQQQDDKRLICYYITSTGTTPENIHSFLLERMPLYMIPSRFIAVSHFPLTANGKTDRSELSAYVVEDHEGNIAYVQPKTELQRQLAEIWCSLLELKNIGLDQDFFYLGGNSILAYKLVSVIRSRLKLPLQIADLFRQPTIEKLSAYLSKKRDDLEAAQPVIPVIKNERVILSSQQQSLWFLDRLNGSLPYHIGAVYPIEENISVKAMQTAFQLLLNRHTILRTTIDEEDNHPYQYLITAENWVLEEIDDTVPLSVFMDIPFDLSRDYMLRAYLIHKSGKSDALCLIIHHIATDGWSMPLLIKELNDLYNQVAHHKKPVLSDQPLQYRDYSYWQQNNISQKKLDKGLTFWKNYLQDVPVLQLAHDFPRPEQQSITGKQHSFFIDKKLSKELRKLSESQHVTQYMTLLSAFALLMQYHSGQNDICIGTPAANRTPSTVDETIGYFINMLPIRIKINGNPIYKDFLQYIRQLLPAVFQHQEIPLESIARHIDQERIKGYNPLFQTVFILQEHPDTSISSTPIVNHQLEWIYNGKSKFDLQFEVTPKDDGLQVVIEYSDALFAEDTIASIALHYRNLLQEIAENARKKIGDFKISTALEQLPTTVKSFKSEKTLIGMFEDQVRLLPDKAALTMEGMSLTYQQLDLQANLIANYLLKAGVKRTQFVACLLEQSTERVSCLLGIMKSGAAYVPLDTTHPSERIAHILEDTKPSFLITTKKYRSIAEELNASVLYLEDMVYQTPVHSEKQTFIDTHLPSDLVYVIHTSGTTGLPKGVLIEHRSLSNFLIQYGDLLEISSEDRTLQFSPYNFDGSVMDLWIPLSKGATIHLYPNNKLLGAQLTDFLQLNAITAIPFISPSVLSTFSQSVLLPSLRVIGTGGETCPATLSRHWMYKVKLVNGYGPTETTVAVNKFKYDIKYPGTTIGKPIDNMRFYILDKYLRKVPKGVIGELYLSGIQVARGYLNQPDLTTARFLPNPFIKTEGKEDLLYARMYRTGDQVRSLPDDMVVYIGREDHQIKIRGYRIEISEIENILQQMEGIGQAIVQVNKQEDNVLSLRAFVTGTKKKVDIRNELHKKLPAYMIPNEIIRIEEVPVKSNGKMDMTALSILATQDLTMEEEVELQPMNEFETRLSGIWAEVLQKKSVGPEEDFFHLGGHSLLLAKLYSRVSEHYPGRISLGELFVCSTVRKLALLIQERSVNSVTEHYSLGNDPLSQELKRDAEMEIDGISAIRELKKGNFTKPKAILLTGVTGFVGINMLSDFLKSTTAVIYLLIRATDEHHAALRLQETLNKHLFPLSLYDTKRVRLIPGDLSKPLLGLSSAVYEKIAKRIDVIHHAGSAVNFIQPYSYMKAVNVGGLNRLIKLAATTKLKQICLLSTVGVYSWEHYFTHPPLIMETDSIEFAFKYLSKDMGYIQSKWVMEKIASQAIKKGMPIVIFRLGYAFCHRSTGASAKYQWWSLLVKTCIELKAFPILRNQREELVTVDFISKAIAHISVNPKANGKIFHLSPAPEDNLSMGEFFSLLQQEFNLELKPTPYQEWMRLWENDDSSPLYPLLSLFKFKVYENKSIIEIHQDTPDFDISNTLSLLEGSSIIERRIDREILIVYCKYLGIFL